MKNIEDVKEYPLMEQVKHVCIEDHEEKEVEFRLYDKYDYPSLCVIRDTSHLENKNIRGKLTNILCEEEKVNIDHNSKDEIIKHHISSNY